MNQVSVYVIKTKEGYLNNNFNYSESIHEACLFNNEKSAKVLVEDAGETMDSPNVVKVLKTTYLTPII